jgi:hypothetical protein
VQNSCKNTRFLDFAFPVFSGHSLRLLHTCTALEARGGYVRSAYVPPQRLYWSSCPAPMSSLQCT